MLPLLLLPWLIERVKSKRLKKAHLYKRSAKLVGMLVMMVRKDYADGDPIGCRIL